MEYGFYPYDLDNAALTKCANCGNEAPAGGLYSVANPSARLSAGSEVPAGECRACGALAYLKKD